MLNIFISFLEGVITFISPCFLPMLPIYISYFMGGSNQNQKNAFVNSLGFVMGFTIIFTILGAFSAVIGGFLIQNRVRINIISGLIIILLGLKLLNIIKLPYFNMGRDSSLNLKKLNFFTSVIFGIIFAVTWSPCVGVFLGSALIRATYTGEVLTGSLMLFSYSLGLGVPLILTTLIANKISIDFNFIKKNYKIINFVCGLFLIIMGVFIITGFMDKILAFTL